MFSFCRIMASKSKVCSMRQRYEKNPQLKPAPELRIIASRYLIFSHSSNQFHFTAFPFFIQDVMGLHYSSVLKANGFVASMGWLIVLEDA